MLTPPDSAGSHSGLISNSNSVISDGTMNGKKVNEVKATNYITRGPGIRVTTSLQSREVKTQDCKNKMKAADVVSGKDNDFLNKLKAKAAGAFTGIAIALKGVASGLLIGGGLGFLCGGPFGLLVGGIVGALVGGGVGTGLGVMAGIAVRDDVFKGLSAKGKPHNQRWMKDVLGAETIQLLTKKYPTAHDIRKIETVTSHLGTKMDEVRGSDNYKKSKTRADYYEEHFKNAKPIVQEYLRLARSRAFPKVPVMFKEWSANANKGEANEKLKNHINVLLDASKQYPNHNSITPLLYIREEVIRELPESDETANKLVEDIDNHIAKLMKITPTWEDSQLLQLTSGELEKLTLQQVPEKQLSQFQQYQASQPEAQQHLLFDPTTAHHDPAAKERSRRNGDWY